MRAYTTTCKDCAHKGFWEGPDEIGRTPDNFEAFKKCAFKCEKCGSGNTITQLTK